MLGGMAGWGQGTTTTRASKQIKTGPEATVTSQASQPVAGECLKDTPICETEMSENDSSADIMRLVALCSSSTSS